VSMTVSEAGRVFTSPAAYADETYFHEACTILRREDPVHWVDVEGFRPFWALTRHAVSVTSRPSTGLPGDFAPA